MKRINFSIILFVLMLLFCACITGCSGEQSSPAANVTAATSTAATTKTGETIDLNQFTQKVWVLKDNSNKVANNSLSFSIISISNGTLKGKLSLNGPVVPTPYYFSPDYFENLTGNINKNSAQCLFSDKKGSSGTVTMIFNSNGEIEAAIKYESISVYTENVFKEGTYRFKPYKLSDMQGFSAVKDQSFDLDLDSWGNVRLVSGTAKVGNKTTAMFYLTDKSGDVLYDFGIKRNSPDITAAASQDVNKDGLKDIIFINDDSGKPTAYIFYQTAGGPFQYASRVSNDINKSGNNKDIKSVLDFLSSKK